MPADRFRHRLPFGAEVRDDGHVRFRLWAPGRSSVSLALEDGGAVVPMTPQPEGWFELVSGQAQAGSAYRFVLDDGLRVPDPASRGQADDVHGPSLVVDPCAYRWRHPAWRGRPWHETVLYELHVGAFTPEGTFDGVAARLDHLVALGVTAIELMPVADFPGTRNWGYDGVLPFAADNAYGGPLALKRLIDAAHGKGLMVFLDVVYNHFGPDGNYLHVYAPDFFTDRHHTPWGAAIDFSRRPVRDFFIHNALYWLEEFRFDGLRFDAVHAITDDGRPHILTELAETVRREVDSDRHVHLVLENDANEARYLGRDGAAKPRHYTAQWNDDYHHVQHVLLAGDREGYYLDYVDDPPERLCRALTGGYVYQGEPSAFRDGERRGEPSTHLPPVAFVNFLQNHDQVGNRAFGDRLTRLAKEEARRAAAAILLLAPQIPMLYMGEEWGEDRPFLFFTDFHDELADAVREDRRREFARFPAFSDPAVRETIPDPNAPDTFAASRLDWSELHAKGHQALLQFHRDLLAIRRRVIVPRLAGAAPGTATSARWGTTGLTVTWSLAGGVRLTLVANVGDGAERLPALPAGDRLFVSPPDWQPNAGADVPPWSVLWLIDELGAPPSAVGPD